MSTLIVSIGIIAGIITLLNVLGALITNNDSNYCVHCYEYKPSDFLDGKCPVCRRKLKHK